MLLKNGGGTFLSLVLCLPSQPVYCHWCRQDLQRKSIPPPSTSSWDLINYCTTLVWGWGSQTGMCILHGSRVASDPWPGQGWRGLRGLPTQRCSPPLQAQRGGGGGTARVLPPDSKVEIHVLYAFFLLDIEKVTKQDVEKSVQESNAANLFHFFSCIQSMASMMASWYLLIPDW